MIVLEHDPITSWRNYQRIQFIKGFYLARKLVYNLIEEFESTGRVPHESIDSLLEVHLRYLKDLSHVLYRMPDDQTIDRKRQRIFDKILGTLWHELDKCRDNIRLLEAYSEQINNSGDKFIERISRLDNQVLSAARRDLPYQFRRARRIMEELVPLFEQILPVYEENEVVLRSIYFARDHFEPLFQVSPIEYFFPLLYGSVADGYQRLIGSLVNTKHLKQAALALEEFEAWSMAHPEDQSSLHETRLQYQDLLKKRKYPAKASDCRGNSKPVHQVDAAAKPLEPASPENDGSS